MHELEKLPPSELLPGFSDPQTRQFREIRDQAQRKVNKVRASEGCGLDPLGSMQRRVTSSFVTLIHDVIVQQRRGVNELDCRGGPNDVAVRHDTTLVTRRQEQLGS